MMRTLKVHCTFLTRIVTVKFFCTHCSIGKSQFTKPKESIVLYMYFLYGN